MTDNVRVAHSGIVLPLVVCGAVIVLGAVVYMFGGKSYRVSNNPSVRN